MQTFIYFIIHTLVPIGNWAGVLCALFVFHVLSFFDQNFLPQRCVCGEAVTFHVNSLLQHLKNTQGITEYSLKHFIKDRGIGCVGWQVHFRNRAVQVSAAHIRREWFHVEDMGAFDKCTYYFNLYPCTFYWSIPTVLVLSNLTLS